MRVITERDPAAVARRAADVVADLVRKKKDAVLGFPTGGTPRMTHELLARMRRQEAVRHKALSVGLGTILELARSCLVLACGAAKAQAWAQMIEGPVTARVPASSLQMHPCALALGDNDTASQLRHRDDCDAAEQ